MNERGYRLPIRLGGSPISREERIADIVNRSKVIHELHWLTPFAEPELNRF
jgi:hypothetical protein